MSSCRPPEVGHVGSCCPSCILNSCLAVDVGKTCVALSVTDTARHRLLGPVEFAMTAPALSAVVERIVKALPETGALVKIGVEAAGHYHRPMLDASWPPGWSARGQPGTRERAAPGPGAAADQDRRDRPGRDHELVLSG